jgi:Bor protein
MRSASRLSLVVGACLLSGCFHQIVQTGRTPGTTVVERPWTATWLWGLVPAEEISVVAQCPNGVATIETQQSFLNGLVGGLTLGIYTPQEVRVTCASTSSALPTGRHIDVAHDASMSERIAAIHEAIGLAIETHETVQVRY